MKIDSLLNAVRVTFYFRPTEKNQSIAKKDVNVGVNVGVKLNATQERILEKIKLNPQITHAEIAKNLGMTVRTAERTTKILREMGVIIRIGSDKTGYWEIK